MPQSVTFTQATLKEFGRDSGGAWARFEFPLTKSVISALNWGELADYETKTSLEGDLAATVISLTPDAPELAKQATDIDAQRVYHFVATKQEIEGSRGKGKRWLIQCDVSIRDVAGCQKLEGYMASVPKGKVRVSYERAPEQQQVPGTEDADEDQGEPAAQSAHPDAAPLAPAVTMGGTHQTRKPRADKGTIN